MSAPSTLPLHSTAVNNEPSIRSPPSAVPLRHSSGIQPFDPVPRAEHEANVNVEHPSQELTDGSGILHHYMTVSYLLGFRGKWSLIMFIILGGALVGFVLARSFMLDPRNHEKHLTPGEWFWNRRAPYRGALIAHIWSSFFIAWGVVLQFVPALSGDYVNFHLVNGYVTLFLLPAGVASGWVLARRTLGGEPVTQVVFYLLGLLVFITGTLGMLDLRDVRQHRKWMLRMSSLLGVVVSARVIMLAARAIITEIGTYYTLFNCDEILFLMGSISQYPACVAAQQAGTSLNSVNLGVHASMNEATINKSAAIRLAFRVGLWTALIIHICGVELYIHLTEKQNQHREGYTLTRVNRTRDTGQPC